MAQQKGFNKWLVASGATGASTAPSASGASTSFGVTGASTSFGATGASTSFGATGASTSFGATWSPMSVDEPTSGASASTKRTSLGDTPLGTFRVELSDDNGGQPRFSKKKDKHKFALTLVDPGDVVGRLGQVMDSALAAGAYESHLVWLTDEEIWSACEQAMSHGMAGVQVIAVLVPLDANGHCLGGYARQLHEVLVGKYLGSASGDQLLEVLNSGEEFYVAYLGRVLAMEGNDVERELCLSLRANLQRLDGNSSSCLRLQQNPPARSQYRSTRLLELGSGDPFVALLISGERHSMASTEWLIKHAEACTRNGGSVSKYRLTDEEIALQRDLHYHCTITRNEKSCRRRNDSPATDAGRAAQAAQLERTQAFGHRAPENPLAFRLRDGLGSDEQALQALHGAVVSMLGNINKHLLTGLSVNLHFGKMKTRQASRKDCGRITAMGNRQFASCYVCVTSEPCNLDLSNWQSVHRAFYISDLTAFAKSLELLETEICQRRRRIFENSRRA